MVTTGLSAGMKRLQSLTIKLFAIIRNPYASGRVTQRAIPCPQGLRSFLKDHLPLQLYNGTKRALITANALKQIASTRRHSRQSNANNQNEPWISLYKLNSSKDTDLHCSDQAVKIMHILSEQTTPGQLGK
jgi:hypothetical protein